MKKKYPVILYSQGKCPKGGQHEFAKELTLGTYSNWATCWKCCYSPELIAFNKRCDESNECGICGGSRDHYGECK